MIGKLFKKDINRNIEGVVKADSLSDEAVFQEVDEYVITNELHQKLDDFFEEYSQTIGKTTSDIGVWISGHFGSGKSHLLKILSYILTDDRKHSDLIGELFLEKIDDFELKNNIQKALKSPSKTILFNIDQKSDIGFKQQNDAILSVFMKVFNEMRGYYPKFGYIAQFESDLDKKGKFESFKKKFQEISGESWESGREAVLLYSDDFAKALASVDGISQDSAKELIDKYEENYSLSIEDFAKEVKAYIDKQEPNFRLVFFVDEIGQYIGDNTKLMLNLQTIVETLSTVCKGQAWIVVTSQSAVDELVNSDKKMENDFSKILGRFKVKLNLTSQNANEVIQKRLLDKKEEAKRDLQAIYQKIKNSLPSIIHFTDRSRMYKNYKTEDDFILSYPFIPYQFDLLQSSITGLSKHNVFQGRHQSTGERSMLDVVQNIAKKIADKEIGNVATYDGFFDGLSSIIRGDVQTQIQKATDILTPFEAKVLKTLFMVKYVKEFTSNLDNITTLLIDNIIDINISKLKKDVKNALEVLNQQKYIQKVGDRYEYLTDVEQDIEKEIASTEIEQREVINELVSWIYDDIIKINKIRYSKNRQIYPFTRKLDDVIVKGTKEEDLSIDIITPYNSMEYDDKKLFHKSMAERGLFISLPNSYELMQDLETYVKTKKYIPQKQSGSLSNNEKILLMNKADNNNTRREKLQNDIKEYLENAPIYLNGKTLEIASKDIKTRLESAFETLIQSVYPSISLLTKVYEEQDIKTILEQSDDLLTGSDDALTQAESEIYGYIKREKNSHKTTTISTILEHFKTRPYGWYQNAILSLLASMYMKQKIDLKQNSTPLNKDEVLQALLNNRQFHTIITVREEIAPQKIQQVKSILTQLYPEVNFQISTPRDIYQLCKTQTSKLTEKIKNYKNLNYPFGNSFDEILEVLTPLSRLKEDELFDKLTSLEDDLLDCKEDLIEPLMEFMNGEQRKIYDEIREFLKTNKDNLRYINDSSKVALEELLKNDKAFLGQHIQRAKKVLDSLKDRLTPLIESNRQEAIEKIDNLIQKIQSNKNFQKVPVDERHKIIKPLLHIKDEINDTINIDTIKQRVSAEALDNELINAEEKMYELIPEDIKPTNKPKAIKFAQVYPKTIHSLSSEEDVREYIKDLEQKLLQEIKEGKEIIL